MERPRSRSNLSLTSSSKSSVKPSSMSAARPTSSHSAFSSKEKKISPGRKQQRHSTEIGSEYHRWWTVRSCLGFQTNEQIAGLLLDGFYALLENIVTSGGGRTYDTDSPSARRRGHDMAHHRGPSSPSFLSSSSSSTLTSSSTCHSARAGTACPPPGLEHAQEFSQYNGGIDHYTELIWRMCGQSEIWLERMANASPALQSFLVRLIGYLRNAKGRGFSLNYRKKKFSGKPSSLALPPSYDLRVFPSISPNVLRPDAPFRPLSTPFPLFPGGDNGSMATSVQHHLAMADSATVQVNLTDFVGGQSAMDDMFPNMPPPYATSIAPCDADASSSSSTKNHHTPNAAAVETKERTSIATGSRSFLPLFPGQNDDETRFKPPQVSHRKLHPLDSDPIMDRPSSLPVNAPSPPPKHGSSPEEDARPSAHKQIMSLWDRIKANDVTFLDQRLTGESNSETNAPDPLNSTKTPHQESTVTCPTAAINVCDRSRINGLNLHTTKISSATTSDHLPYPNGTVPYPYIASTSLSSRTPVNMKTQVHSSMSGKALSQTSTVGASWLLYPSPSLQPQDNSLASLSSLVQNIVYNSQGSILKPLASVQTESSSLSVREKTQSLLPSESLDSTINSKDLSATQTKLSPSHIHLITPSLSTSGPKHTVVPLLFAPPINLPARFPSVGHDMSLTSNFSPANLLTPTSLSVRQNNSMMVNFNVYKMSQDHSTAQPEPGCSASSSWANHGASSESDIKIRDVRSCHEDEHLQMDDASVDCRGQANTSSKAKVEKQTQSPNRCYDSKPSKTTPLNPHQPIYREPHYQYAENIGDIKAGENFENDSTTRPSPSVTASFFPPTNEYSSPKISNTGYSNLIGGHASSSSIGNSATANNKTMKMLPSILMGEPCYNYDDRAVATSEIASRGIIKSSYSDRKEYYHRHDFATPLYAASKQTVSESMSTSNVLPQQANFYNAPISSTLLNPNERGQPSAQDPSISTRETQPSASYDSSRSDKSSRSSRSDDPGNRHGPIRKSSKHSSRSSTCYTCSLVFCSATDLLVHRYELHSFVCRECDGRFLSESRLQQHKLSDHPQMKKCLSCRFVSFSQEDITKHMWCEHGIKSEDVCHSKEHPLESTIPEEPESSDTHQTPVATNDSHGQGRGQQSGQDNRGDLRGILQNPDSSKVNKVSSSPKATVSQSKHRQVNVVSDQAFSKSVVGTPPEAKSHSDDVDVDVNSDLTNGVSTGPVFPSFKRQVQETSTATLRNLADMYSQVNQHCHLDSTDFLFQSTPNSFNVTDNSQLPFVARTGSVGDADDESESTKMEDENRVHVTGAMDSEPLCLVVHKRNSKSKKATQRSDDVCSRTRPAKRTERSRLGGNEKRTMTDERGDNNTSHPDWKLPPRRRREAVSNTAMGVCDESQARKKRKASQMDYDSDKAHGISCSKRLVINVDKNNMLSLRTKAGHSSFEERKLSPDDEMAFFEEKSETMEEPCLEIDYAEEEDEHYPLSSGYKNADETTCRVTNQETTSNTMFPHKLVDGVLPKGYPCRQSAQSSFHVKKRSSIRSTSQSAHDDPHSGASTRSSASNRELLDTNSRLASLRERDRYGHNHHLPPKKRSFRKSTRAGKRSSGTSDFESEKDESLLQDGIRCQINSDNDQRGDQQRQHQTQQLQQQQQQQQQQEQQHLSGRNSKCDGKKQRFQCPHKDCHSTFSRKWTMDCHIRKIHDGKFMCEFTDCETVCDSKSDLRHHMNVYHSGRNRKWKCGCAGCAKVFYSHAHLRVHALTHTGEKPMACDQCDYRCRQGSALAWHKKKKHQHHSGWGQEVPSYRLDTHGNARYTP